MMRDGRLHVPEYDTVGDMDPNATHERRIRDTYAKTEEQFEQWADVKQGYAEGLIEQYNEGWDYDELFRNIPDLLDSIGIALPELDGYQALDRKDSRRPQVSQFKTSPKKAHGNVQGPQPRKTETTCNGDKFC